MTKQNCYPPRSKSTMYSKPAKVSKEKSVSKPSTPPLLPPPPPPLSELPLNSFSLPPQSGGTAGQSVSPASTPGISGSVFSMFSQMPHLELLPKAASGNSGNTNTNQPSSSGPGSPHDYDITNSINSIFAPVAHHPPQFWGFPYSHGHNVILSSPFSPITSLSTTPIPSPPRSPVSQPLPSSNLNQNLSLPGSKNGSNSRSTSPSFQLPMSVLAPPNSSASSHPIPPFQA